MILRGRAFKFGDNISTDHIIPGRWFHLRSNLPELSKHLLEDVASREHAPLVIKMAGVGAVLAKSTARIFFRNAINLGLPVLVCDTSQIDEGDELEVNLTRGIVSDLTNGSQLSFGRIPEVMLRILEEGGLVPYIKKHSDFKL